MREDLRERLDKVHDILEREESSKRLANGYLALKALETANGTIRWHGPKKCPFGFQNIWQYCAATYHPEVIGKKPFEIANLVQDYQSDYRAGFNLLDDKILDSVWKDHIIICRLPESGRAKTGKVSFGSSHIVCITVDPNEEANIFGMNVRDVSNERETQRAANYTRNAIKRNFATGGYPAVRAMQSEVLGVFSGNRLEGPKE